MIVPETARSEPALGLWCRRFHGCCSATGPTTGIWARRNPRTQNTVTDVTSGQRQAAKREERDVREPLGAPMQSLCAAQPAGSIGDGRSPSPIWPPRLEPQRRSSHTLQNSSFAALTCTSIPDGLCMASRMHCKWETTRRNLATTMRRSRKRSTRRRLTGLAQAAARAGAFSGRGDRRPTQSREEGAVWRR